MAWSTYVSKIYRSALLPLRWRCAEGHEWEANLNNIRNQGTWCRRGGLKMLSIDHAHQAAASRGGRCLSKDYVNCRSPLIWQCAEGHEWTATLTNVRNSGSWGPACAGKLPLSIEIAVQVAESRGGVCLSKKYQNNKKSGRGGAGRGGARTL